MHNPDCDGNVTTPCRDEVRVLPTTGGSLNLCHAHYFREMVWRRERNKSVASPHALPAWESLARLRAPEPEARPEFEDSRE